MNNITLYHHLGLGDHFICNGIVRTLAEKFNKIYLFCKKPNVITVQQMYSDVNVSIIPVNDDNEVFEWANQSQVFQIGFGAMNTNENFDQQFYRQCEIDFTTRWSKFKCNRNFDREKKLIEYLDIPRGFALVHEDRSRGFNIDYTKINLPTVNLSQIDGFSMIDWLGVLEMADETHIIDSSFLFLVDSFDFNVKLYIHRYARRFPIWQSPTLKKDWKIIH